MEIIWNNLYSNEKLKLYHTKFKKMEIIKIIEIDENGKWDFKGCYTLNLKYNNNQLADYHFYTTNYFLDDGVKLMCIQPLIVLDNEHKFDTKQEINERIITWFNNCKQKYNTGLDVLGQRHGSFTIDNYKNLQKELEWEEVAKTKSFAEIKKKTIETNFNSAVNGMEIAIKLFKEELIEIIINCEKITIDEIFS